MEDFNLFLEKIDRDLTYNPYNVQDIDPDIFKEWQRRSQYDLMFDVWGAAHATIELYKKYGSNAALTTELNSLSRICFIICNNPNVTDGLKWELKIAEYGMYDFIFGENILCNDATSVMNWFDERYYKINYDLI